MTREEKYKLQMLELGIYEEIFDPEIKTLSQLERELTRAQKAWSATAKKGEKPSFTDPIYQVIQKLRAEILQHREALGLTPKALRKLKGTNFETLRAGELAGETDPENVTVLDLVREKFAL